MKKIYIFSFFTFVLLFLSACSEITDKIKNKNNPDSSPQIPESSLLFSEFQGDWLLSDVKLKGCISSGRCLEANDFSEFYPVFPTMFAELLYAEDGQLETNLHYFGISSGIGEQNFSFSSEIDANGFGYFSIGRTANYHSQQEGQIELYDSVLRIHLPNIHFDNQFIPSGIYTFRQIENGEQVKNGLMLLRKEFGKQYNVLFKGFDNEDPIYHVFEEKLGHMITIDEFLYSSSTNSLTSLKDQEEIDYALETIQDSLANENLLVEYYKSENNKHIFRIFDTIEHRNEIVHKQTVNWGYYDILSERIDFELGEFQTIEKNNDNQGKFRLLPTQPKSDILENSLSNEQLKINYIYSNGNYHQVIYDFDDNINVLFYFEDDTGLYLIDTSKMQEEIINDPTNNWLNDVEVLTKILIIRYPIGSGKPTTDNTDTMHFVHHIGFKHETHAQTFNNAIEVRHYHSNPDVFDSYIIYEPGFGIIELGEGPLSQNQSKWVLVVSENE